MRDHLSPSPSPPSPPSLSSPPSSQLIPSVEPIPLKVESSDDTSSEGEHSFDIKKEENTDWLDLESDLSEKGSGDTTNLPDSTLSPTHIITTEQPNVSPAHTTIPSDASLPTATVVDKPCLSSPPLKPQVDSVPFVDNTKALPPPQTTITSTTMVLSPGKASSTSSHDSSHRKNDSGVENSSESDGGGGGEGGEERERLSEKTDQMEDLDFSIDMSKYSILSKWKLSRG